jgi:flavodoxin
MKTLILYHSYHHGNTERVAKAISKAFGVQPLKFIELGGVNLQDYDVIGLGSGIYFGGHHKPMVKFIKDQPELKKKVFIFSTAGFPLMKPAYHMDLRLKLWGKGATMLGEFSCPGYDTYGPYKLIGGLNRGRPNNENLDNAKEFGRKMKAAAASD